MCFKKLENCFVISMECHMKQVRTKPIIERFVWKIHQNHISRRGKMISSLLCGWKISQPQNQCLNLLLARAVNQIVQTLVSADYFQWNAPMYVNVEGFAETLFIIQSKVMMIRLKGTLKMMMLIIMLRIFDADYIIEYIMLINALVNCLICLSSLVYTFRCVNSRSSLSAKTIQSYLSKRYLGVYIPDVSSMVIF